MRFAYRHPRMTLRLRFDRGTLELGPTSAGLPCELWDPRSESLRVAAHRFGALVDSSDRHATLLEGDLRRQWSLERRDLKPLGMRSYQAEALACWTALGRRGVVVLPTGAGKTRVALAAIFDSGLPTAILCPTRALAAAWVEQLEAQLRGVPIGLVGDGHSTIERITVMTFESAYRRMDQLGDRFGLLVVDEVHHFGSGARMEALEASAAIARLGLTATAPEADSAEAQRLTDLVGPVVYELGFTDLVGTHLAPLSIVKIPVRLEPDERERYETLECRFREMRRAFLRIHPEADLPTVLRALGATYEGRRAIRDRARALELACFPRAKRRLVERLLFRHKALQTLVFTAFAENAYEVATDNLIPVITAETDAKERQYILNAFRRGDLRALATARVLNEGIDVPEASVAIVVAGVLGAREHVQRVGRVLRPAPEKRATVYELITLETTDARRAIRRSTHAPRTAS
jgi:superfamily II DNA or RNA helicase